MLLYREQKPAQQVEFVFAENLLYIDLLASFGKRNPHFLIKEKICPVFRNHFTEANAFPCTADLLLTVVLRILVDGRNFSFVPLMP